MNLRISRKILLFGRPAIRALLLLAAVMTGPASAAAPHASSPKFPYSFEQNRGQSHGDVRYLARGEGYTLFLTEREAVMSLSRAGQPSRILRMSLAGSRPPQSIEPLDRRPQTTNYFIGDEPSRWRKDVPHFARLRYAGVYDGIDLIYHSADDRLEYDFVVSPGADAGAVRLSFAGVDGVGISSSGDLELKAGGAVLKHRAPIAYQSIDGRRVAVAAAYELRDGNQVGFRIGEYDRSRELVVDPVVVYSTFLGGDRNETVHSAAVDAAGNVYLTGETTSGNFPVVGPPITPNLGAVVYSFITKFNAKGDGIVYSTILGGSSSTRGYAIDVDAEGNAYVAGVTGARNFPLVNPTQSQQPILNIGYVAKLNAAGNALLFATYLGGERNDELNALSVDPAGNIHVAGRATSSQIQMTNALQPVFGGNTDILLAKYRAPDYRLVYSTYLGKSGLEFAYGVTSDGGGATYITGLARGESLATEGAFQNRVNGGNDAFAAKITPMGDRVEWFSYFGSQGDEQARGIALDDVGAVWIAGSTTSPGFPTTANAVQGSMKGDSDAFAVRFDAAGRDILYSTLLGSSTSRAAVLEEAYNIKLDPQGSIYIAGVANGADFPSVRPLQAFGGGTVDGFLVKLNSHANEIIFSTLLGGSANDFAHALAIDRTGAAYVGGETLSANFPLKAALRSTFAGSDEAFVTKICDPFLVATPDRLTFTYSQTGALPAAKTLAISACSAIPYSIEVSGAFLEANPIGGNTDGETTVTANPAGLEVGAYSGMLTLSSPGAVNSPLEVFVKLFVNPPPPVISAAGIVNAASGQGGAVSPGELIVIYGLKMGSDQLVTARLDDEGKLATELEGTRVLVEGVAAPLIYASAQQVSAVVNYAAYGRAQVRVEVEYMGSKSNPVEMPVVQTLPGVFTYNGSGSGLGAILHPDYSINGPENPAPRGGTIILYATGEGQTDPAGVDGKLATAVLAKPLASVSVTIGGVAAIIDYAGSAPSLVAGVMQINARIPEGIPAGLAEVLVTVGDTTSAPGVVVAVQ